MAFITDPITMYIESRYEDGSYRTVKALYKGNKFQIEFDKPGICDNPADFEQYVPVANPYDDHVLGNFSGKSDKKFAEERKERLLQKQKEREDQEKELAKSVEQYLGKISQPVRYNKNDTGNE